MSIKQKLISELEKVLKDLEIEGVKPVVDYPTDTKFGDYSSNIALVAAKKLGKNPLQLAEDLRLKIKDLGFVDKVEVAPPGFINFWILNDTLINSLSHFELPNSQKGKKIVVEYTDPNPFKEFHIGHLYSNVVGESISRLKEVEGATVWRADYFGDVGMHVAKAIWGVLRKLRTDLPAGEAGNLELRTLEEKPLEERIKFFGQAYALGATAYEENESAKEDMKQLNFIIFKSAQEVVLPQFKEKPQINYDKFIKENKYEYEEIKQLYKIGREWSLEYFETIYKRLGTKFDGYYPESRTGEYGYGMVLEGLKKKIFEEGERGAIIFPGSKHGLHERVFINSLGLPTYETKDFGNAVAKKVDFDYDESIIVTGNEINEYFYVVLKALSLMRPDLGGKTIHLGHGMVRLPSGKMSSRTGKIKTGESLLDSAKQSILEQHPTIGKDVADVVGMAAIKYAFLRSSVGRDIIFDIKESINFEGNSGPYLQYTYARTQSVLSKVQNSKFKVQSLTKGFELKAEERLLLRLLARFPEIVAEAAERLAPNLLCTYLFELAQAFNLFYQKHQILIEMEEIREIRLALTKATGETIKKGLYLLGIKAPEKM